MQHRYRRHQHLSHPRRKRQLFLLFARHHPPAQNRVKGKKTPARHAEKPTAAAAALPFLIPAKSCKPGKQNILKKDAKSIQNSV